MPPHQTSIQAFYEQEPPPSAQGDSGQTVGDGFDRQERHPTCLAGLPQWHPKLEYTAADIADLKPGVDRVEITGRIVYLYHHTRQSKSPTAAKGCWRLVVKDETAAMTV
jgi:hypothetical protein